MTTKPKKKQAESIAVAMDNLLAAKNSIEASEEIVRHELYNLDAECAVLGTIILNNEYLDRVLDFLHPEHFYDPANRKIYEQIIHHVEKASIVANQITLKNFFDSEPAIKAVGGSKYLSTLLTSASVIINIINYARIIYDFALKRELVKIGEQIVVNAYQTEEKTTGLEQIETAEANLFDLAKHGSQRNNFRKISVTLKEALDKTHIAKTKDSHISGISSGFNDLDRILGGLQNSDLVILAGRPSMGKTAVAINIAINACKYLNRDVKDKKDERAVGFFSLEMSSDQLSARILSMESSINATKFRTGNLNEFEWEAVAVSSAEISKWPFYIDDTPALSISAVRTRARRMIRKYNLAFLVIDYLQLIRSTRHSDNRVQEIAEITQGLKAIAKEFDIPVLALSQLSREVEKREDKRPQLSDLRESGTIEQDADVVTFIYRESYYHERKKPAEDDPQYSEWKKKMDQVRHLSEIMVAKQRNGPIGSLNLYFDAEFTRFRNWSGRPEDIY